ncbi:MAG: uracil-xanthine permease family protein [Lachnospiraceae bacterium]|nr:uracil-xanthine permease family protein [Lachnospiraceae bacterium]
MSQETKEGIYSVKEMGAGKTLLLGLQHMFAMFGATVLVPILTGLDVATTLLFAGLGTLLFHVITKRKVPAFLGSSFAFLSGYAAVKCMEGITDAAGNTIENAALLPYACVGVCFAGLLYFVLAAFIKAFGVSKVMKCFPPVVTGPIIIAIGLTLSASAITNCSTNWWLAIVTILVVVICNIYGKGMVKIIPILIAVVVSYLLAAVTGNVDFSGVRDAAWIGLPIKYENTVFSVFGADFNPSFFITSIVTIMPIALATIVEHIGDISAISSTTGHNYFKDPGLHRTLMGDGAATILASLFGAPANTTYGENTGVLTLSKVYDPFVIELAAGFAILFSFCPKFAAVISAMPAATIGGISLVLYGMISAVGVRNIVESHVDFSKSRNVIIAALILVLSIGIKYYNASGDISFMLGQIKISFSGIAAGALVGIILNAILPGKDYEFDAGV